jgi:hypothetical protein
MRNFILKFGLWFAATHAVILLQTSTTAGQAPADGGPQLVDSSNHLVDVWVNCANGLLYENDRLNVVVEAIGDEHVFVYLIYVDVEGDAILIFPNHCERDHRVTARRRRQLPGEGSRFSIDGPLGDEILLTIASTRRLPELDSLIGNEPGPLPILAAETLYNDLLPKWQAEGVDVLDMQFQTRSRDAEDLQSVE